MTTDIKPVTVSLTLLREALGRELVENWEDCNLAAMIESAKWIGTAVYDFGGTKRGFGQDATRHEVIVDLRILANTMLAVADQMEEVTPA